jgi:glutaredoxin
MYSVLHDQDSIPPPLQIGYTIYSRSGCPYCDLAKELLSFEQVKIVDCDEFLSSNRDEFLRVMSGFCESDYRMFPMIFHSGVFIGGYTEAKEFYQNRMVSMVEDF